MNLLEVIERQNVIIQRQSELITELYKELAQHAALDEIEEELQGIDKLKGEIEDAV